MLDKFRQLKLPYTLKSNEEVCLFLDEKYIKSTDSRKKIEKKLDQYCVWHKDKRKYIITSVHDTVQKYEDGRINNQGGNNNKYAEEVDDLILFLLEWHHQLDESTTYFINELGMCSGNLYDFAKNAKSIAESYNGYPEWYAWDFFATVRGVFKQQILGSFGRLEKRGLITVIKRTFVMDIEGEYAEATEQQLEDAATIKKKLLDQFKFSNLQSLITFGKYLEYSAKYNDLLIDDLGIILMFDKYEITQVMGQPFTDALSISDDKDFYKCGKSLNEDICNGIIENARNRKMKAEQRQIDYDFDWGFDKEDRKKLPYAVGRMASKFYNYVDFYKEMVDRYIRIQSKEQLSNNSKVAKTQEYDYEGSNPF